MSALEKTVAKAIIQVIGEIARLSPEIGDRLAKITRELETIRNSKSG
jgi:hypothetical protein